MPFSMAKRISYCLPSAKDFFPATISHISLEMSCFIIWFIVFALLTFLIIWLYWFVWCWVIAIEQTAGIIISVRMRM